MVQTQPALQTFEDFLAQADTTDAYYELTNGALVEMPLSLMRISVGQCRCMKL
jgi:Uma2 family endonuclease